jgi:hypothetical protein
VGVLGNIEIRETFGLSQLQKAKRHDSFVREFDRQFADWTAVAKVCVEVEREREWEILGFDSFPAWLVSAAPKSRSYLYLVMGRYKELIADIPETELAQIPLGSAGVLKQLSPAVRRNPRVQEAAKKKPQELCEVLDKEFGEQHVEARVKKILWFPVSAWAIIESKYEAYKLKDEHAQLEDFIEFLVSESES